MGPGQSQILQAHMGLATFHSGLEVDFFPPLEPERGEAYCVVSYTEADRSQFLGELPGYSAQALCPTSPGHPPRHTSVPPQQRGAGCLSYRGLSLQSW